MDWVMRPAWRWHVGARCQESGRDRAVLASPTDRRCGGWLADVAGQSVEAVLLAAVSVRRR